MFHDRLKSERGLNGIADIENFLDSGDWQGGIDRLYELIWYIVGKPAWRVDRPFAADRGIDRYTGMV